MKIFKHENFSTEISYNENFLIYGTPAYYGLYNTVVSCKYAPHFANLALVQNAGGAYTRDATISLVITPSLPVPVKHDLAVGGGQAQGGEMFPTLPVG